MSPIELKNELVQLVLLTLESGGQRDVKFVKINLKIVVIIKIKFSNQNQKEFSMIFKISRKSLYSARKS